MRPQVCDRYAWYVDSLIWLLRQNLIQLCRKSIELLAALEGQLF